MSARPGATGRHGVLLDRDGVINAVDVRDGKGYAPTRLEDFRVLPGVVDAIDSIRRYGAAVAVVTNQPDIGNGKTPAEVVEAMHTALRKQVAIELILVCPHRQTEGCRCRKPQPGLLLDAIETLRLDPALTWMVGDRWSDVAAGRAAGVRTVFVDRNYAETPARVDADSVAKDLPEAIAAIQAAWRGLKEERPKP